jgi:hypothetical protein
MCGQQVTSQLHRLPDDVAGSDHPHQVRADTHRLVLTVETQPQPVALTPADHLGSLTQPARERPVLLCHLDLLNAAPIGDMDTPDISPPVIDRPRVHDAIPAAVTAHAPVVVMTAGNRIGESGSRP